MRHAARVLWFGLAIISLGACASEKPSRPHREHAKPAAEDDWQSPRKFLLAYDGNHDGQVTRAELEAGLHKEFDAADSNHNGKLEPDEMLAVNEARQEKDLSAASPLIDWTNRGYIVFDEFAAEPRSLFEQVDANGDGVLSADELKPPHQGKEKEKTKVEGPSEHRRRRSPDGDDLRAP